MTNPVLTLEAAKRVLPTPTASIHSRSQRDKQVPGLEMGGVQKTSHQTFLGTSNRNQGIALGKQRNIAGTAPPGVCGPRD